MNPQTITAAWLREYRPLNGILPLGADCAAILADALDLADDAARSDIETCCEPTAPAPAWWWNLDSAGEDDREAVDEAVRYLDARGLFVRHSQNARLIRFPECAA